MNKNKIAVIGGGSWATALVKIFQNNADLVYWWLRDNDTVNYIKEYKHNKKYLPYVALDTNKLYISSDIKEIISKADVLVWALPAAFLHQTLIDNNIKNLEEKFIVSSIKGIVPEENLLVTEYFQKHYHIPTYNISVIGGPCHSEEVAMEKLSYLTVACEDKVKANFLVEMLSCRYIKVFTTKDVKGVEYASVIKNIVAIANGIANGLGYGDNFQSVLVVNAIEEMRHFLEAAAPGDRFFQGSAYLGDLIVTSYSQFSRNRAFGNLIGKGYSVQYSRIEMKMVAEGYYATKCIKEINEKYGVNMPINEAVYGVLYDNLSPAKAISILAENLT